MCALTAETTTLTDADGNTVTGILCHDQATVTLHLVAEPNREPLNLDVDLKPYGIRPERQGHVFIPKWTDEPSHAEQLADAGLVRIERLLALTDQVADDLPALTIYFHEVEVLG